MDAAFQSPKDILKRLHSSKKGLDREEVTKRLRHYGHNEVTKKERPSSLKLFLNEFKDPLIILLLVAALVRLGIGFSPGQESGIVDASLIFTIVIANAGFGFWQRKSAEDAIEALRNQTEPKATVIRGGKRVEIPSTELVPGDILLVDEGTRISADARIIEEAALRVDESSLTGESVPVDKRVEAVNKETALAEHQSMLFAGTIVTQGRGKAVVVHTGEDSQLGTITKTVGETEKRETHFEKNIRQLSRKLGIVSGILVLLIFVVKFLLGTGSLLTIFITSVALVVAAIPEGLPAVVTMTLGAASKRLAQKNAIVRRLGVIESLGSVDVILTDKTGTMTKSEMHVVSWFDANGTKRAAKQLARCCYHCNDAENGHGDPTELALKEFGDEHNVSPIPRLDEKPFTSKRKMMSVLTEDGVFVKGAPEKILEQCSVSETIYEKVEELEKQGHRVIACAYKDTDTLDEENLSFIGCVGLQDPPRPDVRPALQECRENDIRVIMATGDSKETARAIGEELGFKGKIATGKDVGSWSDAELESYVKDVAIFARMDPTHKFRVLQALQRNGNITAMTGDGVNDSAALKAADVGISMGQRGTDAAQQASDIILQDDAFSTIVEAVKEGRKVTQNIKTFLSYILSTNTGEVLTVFVGTLLASFIGVEEAVFSAGLLLWLNLVTDGLPAVALGVDRREAPKPSGSFVTQKTVGHMAVIGILISILTLTLYGVRGVTSAFMALVFMELASIPFIRGPSAKPNPWLGWSVVGTIFFQFVIVLSPLRAVFGLEPLRLTDGPWIVATLILFVLFLYAEKFAESFHIDEPEPLIEP